MQLANIAVYPADSTDFSHQGYGILSDVLSAVVTEATADNNNVSQELEVTYPIGGTNVEYIKNTNMIRASTGTGADDYMIFEIYDYDENTDGTLSVHAQALPYRILKIPFDNGGIFDKFATVQLAINGGLSHVTGFPNWFHITSDVDVKQDFRKDQISNLGGMLDLILDRTECYVEYGWNYIKILKNRGKQITDVVLRDDSNVSGVQVVADYSNIINKIVPLLRARNAAGEYTDEPDYVGKIVTSKNPFKYIKYWSGMAAKFDGQEVADNYFVKEGVDQPKITATVNPLIIDDNLTAVKLFDSMQVYASKINYTATLKVVSRTFDALTCEVTDFKLGDKKKTLIDNNSTLSNIEDKINQANDTAQDAITSSNGKNTNYYSEDEPKNPVEGDTWFHTDDKGRPIIDQYIDGKWVQIVGHEKEDEVDKAIDQAQKEAEEAKKQANKAVDGANDAVAQAGFANDTADQAKSDAAAAGQQAKDALTSAGTAIIDAKKALTDSGSAMADSAQARKDSATAIKDAADSLTSAKDALNKVGSLTTSVTSQFTTVNNELKSKVNQTDYDKLKGTVTTQQTEINQNASGIKLKADKSYADTINNSVVKNTSGIGLLNNQIALTVSKTELNNTLSSYATQTWTQSQIKSTADQINLSVSKVQSNLDNMHIGSRNYLKSSDTFVQLHGVTQAYPNGVWANKWYVRFQPIQRYTEDVWVFSTNYIPIAPTPAQPKLTVGVMNHEDTKLFTILGDFPVIDGRLVAAIDLSKVDKRFDSIIVYSSYSGWGNSEDKNAQFDHYQMERATTVSDWHPAPEDMATEVQFSQLQITVNGIQGTVQNKADQSQITQLANQISLKADTTALNTLKGTVDKQGSEITLNTNSIKLKADQSSVNTLKGTVDKQGSAIGVNTKAIALKANQSTVDTLTGRVSTAEGKITVQADQIAQTVSKTELTSKLNDYATQTWTQSQIKSTADSINLSVSKAQNNLDNMQIGSRNYIKGSNVPIHITGIWHTESNGIVVPNWYVWIPTLIGTASGDWVVSFNIEGLEGHNPTSVTVAFADPKSTAKNRAIGDFAVSKTGRVVAKVNLDAIDNSWTSVLIYSNSGQWVGSQNKKANISHYQIEKGKVVSDWKQANEDNASEVQFSQLQTTVNGIQGTVQNKADQSQVTQLANQITSAVGNSGQVNLAFNSNLESSAGGWYFNKDRWYFSTGRYDVYQGSGSLVYKDYNETGDVWATAFSKSIDVSPGQNISASCQLNRIGNLGAPDGDVYIGVEFYEKEGAPRLSYKLAAMNTASTKWQRLIIDKATAPDKATIAKLIFQVQKNGWISFSQPMLVKADAVGVYQTNLVSQSQITQLSNDINLRVKTNDVINQINISKEGILIDGKRTHITGTTTIDNAVIKDSMIQSITANKLTAGYINASIIKVYNIDVANLVGNKSSFIESNWNAISSYVKVNSNGINIGSGAGVLQLRSDGMHIIDDYKSEDVGLIHSNNVIYHPEINGLTFDLNVKGDYMAWGDESASGYDIKWAYSRTGSQFLGAGMNSYCDITVDPSKTIYTNKIAKKNGSHTTYLNLDTQKIGNNYDPSIGSAGTQLAFGGAGGLYLVNKVSNTYSAISDLLTNMSGLGTVIIPKSITSDGKVNQWFTIKV